MNSMSVQFNEQQLAEVYHLFGQMNDLPSKIFSRAINRTMDGTKTDMSSGIRTVLNAKKKDVDRLILISKCTPGTLSGRVKLSGKLLPMRTFSPKQTSKGVKVKLYVNKEAEVIPSAFMATMKNGYQGVFKRVYKGTPTGMPVNKRWNRLPEAYRLPIRQLFAPSQVTIFIKDEIFNPFKRSVEKRLEVDLQREINYELSKMK
jgi:hypothetical protein